MNKTIRLYNEVLETALRGNWFSFLGLTYELTAAYYFGENLDMLGIPMLMRSLEFYGRWGAHGKVLYLTKKYSSKLNSQTERGIKKEMAVQTEDTQFSTAIDTHLWDDTTSDESPDSSLRDVHFIQDEASGERNDVESSNAETTLLSLDIVDLTSIIKSSQGKSIKNILSFFYWLTDSYLIKKKM
jgi:hypothetical protein